MRGGAGAVLRRPPCLPFEGEVARSAGGVIPLGNPGTRSFGGLAKNAPASAQAAAGSAALGFGESARAGRACYFLQARLLEPGNFAFAHDACNALVSMVFGCRPPFSLGISEYC